MAKVKTISLTILITILSLIVLLFVVQFVDSLINGKTYKTIDTALIKYNVEVASDQQVCLRNYYDILNNTQFKILKDPKTKLEPKYSTPGLYNATLTACKDVVKNLDNVQVPANLPEKKKALFKELIHLKKDNAQVFIDKLNAIKSCGSNNACYTKKENLLGNDPFKAAILAYKLRLTELAITRRLTVSYLFSGVFTEISVKNQLNSIMKSKEAYDKSEAARIKAEKQQKQEAKKASKHNEKKASAKK